MRAPCVVNTIVWIAVLGENITFCAGKLAKIDYQKSATLHIPFRDPRGLTKWFLLSYSFSLTLKLSCKKYRKPWLAARNEFKLISGFVTCNEPPTILV